MTMLSKIEKVRKFGHLVVNLEELYSNFFHKLRLNAPLYQRSGQWMFYSTEMFVVRTKIGVNLSKNMHIGRFLDFEVFLSPIHTKLRTQNCNSNFKNAYWISEVVVNFLNHLMQGSCTKIVQKFSVKKT